MKIVWDEPKRRTNLATHGLDLADAESFEWVTALVIPGMPAKPAVHGSGPSAGWKTMWWRSFSRHSALKQFP